MFVFRSMREKWVPPARLATNSVLYSWLSYTWKYCEWSWRELGSISSGAGDSKREIKSSNH